MPYLKTLDIHLIAWGSLASVELWDCNSSFPALESLTIDEGTCFAIRFSWTFQSISCDQVLDLNIIKLTACRDCEDLEYIRDLRHLWSLGLHQHSPEIEVLNCLHPFPQAFHSLKLNWTMGVVPRLMGNTSLIHHLEVITCDQDPLNVFESEDFPCLHTISHPTAFLSCIRVQGMSKP